MAEDETMSKIINAEAVRELAALLEETGLAEIEYAKDALKIRVVRRAPGAPEFVPALSIGAMTPAAAPAVAAKDEIKGTHPGAVTSPMVGTVYLSPEPGAPAFVAVGDTVKEGQTLLLVEAMKTFNEIKTQRAGVVREILVENQQPVEYGEILAIVE